jgi:hypothetical protein
MPKKHCEIENLVPWEQLTRLRRDTSGRNRIEVPRREVPREVGAPASGMEFARGALP